MPACECGQSLLLLRVRAQEPTNVNVNLVRNGLQAASEVRQGVLAIKPLHVPGPLVQVILQLLWMYENGGEGGGEREREGDVLGVWGRSSLDPRLLPRNCTVRERRRLRGQEKHAPSMRHDTLGACLHSRLGPPRGEVGEAGQWTQHRLLRRHPHAAVPAHLTPPSPRTLDAPTSSPRSQ